MTAACCTVWAAFVACAPLEFAADPTESPPAAAERAYRILLIGDAGAPRAPKEPVLELAAQWAAGDPERTAVVFLGDNVYPAGMPPGSSADQPEAARRLSAQLAVLQGSGARGVFLPGNHDWGGKGVDAHRRLTAQSNFIRSYAARHAVDASMVPEPGCPGPVPVDLANACRLIVLDTEWWLTDRAALPPLTCSRTPLEVAAEVAALLEEDGPAVRLVAGHHPLRSHGRHAGYSGWRAALLPLTYLEPWAVVPLPLVYPLIVRPLQRSPQNAGHPAYGDMARAVAEAMVAAPPLAYVAGHDHALQVIGGDASAHWYLVSGAGSSAKITAVAGGRHSRFARARPGFMVLDIYGDGGVYLQVVTAPAGEVAHRAWLTVSD